MAEFERLEAALDALHQSILAAQFGDLPKVLAEMERLAGEMPIMPSRAIAQNIRTKADRNCQCLQAAARGLRSAQRRLGDLTTAATKLSTYTVRGTRDEVGLQSGTLAQRL